MLKLKPLLATFAFLLTLTACSGASSRLHPAHQTPRLLLTSASASASPTPPPASGDDGFDDGGDDGPAQLTPSLQLSITPSVRAAVTPQGQADALIAPINTPATGEVTVTFGRQGIEEVDVTITGPNFNHTAHIGPGGNPDFTLTLPSQYGDATYTATATVNGQQVEDHKTVTVFSATLTKSADWSADDDTKNNLPPLKPGETIHYNHNTNYFDNTHHTPTELKLKIQPAGLHLDLAPFDILQTYTITSTTTYNDGNLPVDEALPTEQDPTWPTTPDYRDANNVDGDTIYFMDGPGPKTPAMTADIENAFAIDLTIQTVHLHWSLTAYPTYGTRDDQANIKANIIGDACTWTADLTITRQPDGTVVWS